LFCSDFFHWRSSEKGIVSLAPDPSSSQTLEFTHIIGNPPFGGSIDPELQDQLDKKYGFRNGEKIKKETYAFFIVKSLDLLAPDGQLLFICSDTFLTIKTMRGLRRLLMDHGAVQVTDLDHFSDETKHPMVVLKLLKNGAANSVTVNGDEILRESIALTGNFSWRITNDLAKYFAGPSLGHYMIASSGMTVGKNEFFVREIVDGRISEPYEFEYYDDPITLEKELGRARLGKLSSRKIEAIKQQQSAKLARRNVRIMKRRLPVEIQLPHPDYCYYNKASNEIVYSPPSHVIFWKDDGDAVITFKKNGNWYLHGVGGRPYFKREGLTWQLISSTLNTRYLPPGYILDSGAPCAFLRNGVCTEELYFILGWTLTKLCTFLLKEVVNHTKNIQSKDFERLPYPFWVADETKRTLVRLVQDMVAQGQRGRRFTRRSPELSKLEDLYAYREPENFINRKVYYQSRLPL
jgi:hypothetical protein